MGQLRTANNRHNRAMLRAKPIPRIDADDTPVNAAQANGDVAAAER
jgi:hypothetical protein